MARRGQVLPIVRFGRREFIDERWSYASGEHVSILGSTGNGKTTLAYQLLDATAREDLQALVLVMKPRDRTVARFNKQAGFKRVRQWPAPRAWWWAKEPRGYTVWPRHNLRDHEWTRAHQTQVFATTLTEAYARRQRYIVFADETYSLANGRQLGLEPELVQLWTMGRSMDAGLWGASQRPAFVPLWMYSQATHIFLSYDPDKRTRDRYAEIGGMDPELIASGVEQLDEYEWLYVRVAGRKSTICIVGA